jgi:hypothetical protein
MAQVLIESPQTKAFGFDLWIPDYGSIPDKGIVGVNPGPEFVEQELRNAGVTLLPKLVSGSSHETLPAFFNSAGSPQSIDLIFVDGDHSVVGARKDLNTAFEHLAPGGALVFDDLNNPGCPGGNNGHARGHSGARYGARPRGGDRGAFHGSGALGRRDHAARDDGGRTVGGHRTAERRTRVAHSAAGTRAGERERSSARVPASADADLRADSHAGA